MSKADRRKWNTRYASAEHALRAAPAWVADYAPQLPEGRALDIAAGDGRLALWLVELGFDVVAIDISAVGLSMFDSRRVTKVVQDLEEDPRLPDGPFSVVTMFHYRQASLWPAIRSALAPDGVVIAEVATATNLERHAHPSARWLSAPGELSAMAEGMEIVHYDEAWRDTGRHTARLVARAPSA